MSTKQQYLFGIEELFNLDQKLFLRYNSKEDKMLYQMVWTDPVVARDSESIKELDYVYIKKIHKENPDNQTVKGILDRLEKEHHVKTYDGFNTILVEEKEDGGPLSDSELEQLKATISKGRQDYQTRGALTVLEWISANHNPNDAQNTNIVLNQLHKSISELEPTAKQITDLWAREPDMMDNEHLQETIALCNAYKRTLELYNKWLQKQADEFDYSIFFEKRDDEDEPKINLEEIKAAEQEAWYQKSGFSKKWAPTFKDAVEKLKNQYHEAQKNKEMWEAKAYKKAKNKNVFVGEELSGANVSVNYINEKRRSSAIRGSEMVMSEAVDGLRDLGFGKEEIASLLNPPVAESQGDSVEPETLMLTEIAPTEKNRIIARELGIDFIGAKKGEPSNIVTEKTYKEAEDTEMPGFRTFESRFTVASKIDQSKPFAVAYFGDTRGNRYEYAAVSNDIQELIGILKRYDMGEAVVEVYNPNSKKVYAFILYTENSYDNVSVRLADTIKTNSIEQDAIHRYQWMRNKEGGQEYGNQEIIVPQNEVRYNELRHLLQNSKMSFADYQKKYGQLYMRYLRHDNKGDWKFVKMDDLKKLIPPKEYFDNGWVIEVSDFDSPEAIKQGHTADSEADTKQMEPKPAMPEPKKMLDMTVAQINQLQSDLQNYYWENTGRPKTEERDALQKELKLLPARSSEKAGLKKKIDELQAEIDSATVLSSQSFVGDWNEMVKYLLEWTASSGLVNKKAIGETELDEYFADMLSDLATYTFDREREMTWDKKLIDVWLEIVRDNFFEGEVIKLGKNYEVPTVVCPLADNMDVPEPLASFVNYMLREGIACKLISAGYNTAPLEDILPCWTIHFECIQPLSQREILTAFEHHVKVIIKGTGNYDIYFLLPYKLGPGEASAVKQYLNSLEVALARNDFYDDQTKAVSYEDKLKWLANDLKQIKEALPDQRYSMEKLLYIDASTSFSKSQLIMFFNSQPNGVAFSINLRGSIVQNWQSFIPGKLFFTASLVPSVE